MTDRIALVLFLIVASAVAHDLWQGWGATLFMLRKGLALVEWIKFWD